jgi:membrane protease YdiL (CAAX protease family)
MKIIAPIAVVVGFTTAILFLSGLVERVGISISQNGYLNFQIGYQLMLLIIAFLSMACSYFFNPESFKSLFSVGNISAAGEAMKLFGIKEGDSWLKTGISLSVVISIATAAFMYFQLKNQVIDHSLLQSGFVWILIFSLTNSFSEEMIFRLGINGPLDGLLKPSYIFLVSAIVFGLAHFQGMPNGILGMILAGLLGYLLSKSVHETGGMFWAWFIHFLQDVIIISSIFLMRSS